MAEPTSVSRCRITTWTVQQTFCLQHMVGSSYHIMVTNVNGPIRMGNSGAEVNLRLNEIYQYPKKINKLCFHLIICSFLNNCLQFIIFEL